VASNKGAAGAWTQQRAQNPDESRLACAGGPEESVDLPGLYSELHLVGSHGRTEATDEASGEHRRLPGARNCVRGPRQ
jgi:hypothetical protein